MSGPTRITSPLAGTSRTAQVNVTFPKMDLFVKFEVWNVKTKKFVPAANMPVDLMDSNKVVSDTLVETEP